MVKKLVKADGTIAYVNEANGVYKLHNFDGPALIPQGNKRLAEYYLFGTKYTKEAWEMAKKDENGVPFHKTAASKKMGNRN
jgi:hypothetical protein